MASFKRSDGTLNSDTYARKASPSFSGTPTGISATHITTGVLPVGVTGGSGLTDPLQKTGGAMTGAITTNSTFDGVDIATRDAVLTSTTATAGAALPKAGGAMTGNITSASDLSLDVEGDITLTALSDIIHQSTSTNSTAGHHIFKSYNTEIMRIDGLQNRVGIGDSTPNDKLQVAGTITSQHDIGSDTVYNLFSARSSRTNNDYGGLDKQYMQMNFATPGPNTNGESNQHGYGDLRFAFVDGYDTTFHDRVTFQAKGNVGIRTVDPDAVLEIRGQNEATGSSSHGAEEPITMIRGANGSTVQEWVHATKHTTSGYVSNTTNYSWYKLFSPGGYSSAGSPGFWDITCHISGNHATAGAIQKFYLLQSNNHSGVGSHGGANYSVCKRYCDMNTGGGAYSASITATPYYLSSGSGNNNATFFFKCVHTAREPQFTFYAKYIGCTGSTAGAYEQSVSFLGTAINNNHQPANISTVALTTYH